MAKDNERKIAYTMYVEQCSTAKEISETLKVSPKTVGDWVKFGNWKDLRKSKQSGNDTLLKKYNELLESLLDKRLLYEKMDKKDEADTRSYNGIIDEMSKIAAMIDRLQKDGRTSLRIHIMCIEKFMGHLHTTNAKLYMQLVDIQIEYLQLLAEELK